jgi:two-component system, OmpR family, phosphate regulon sensor histidine kinase PhoR
VTLRFRSKLFLATFAVGALSALAVGAVLDIRVQNLTVERIEQTLGAETRLAAEMLAHTPVAGAGYLDEEADRIGRLVGVRVTFVAADGRVLGDSTRSGAALARMENHGQRPEIVAAGRSQGEVLVRRYSTTTEYDTLYAAMLVSHPVVAYVRLAVPLTEVADQQRAILVLSLGGVLASLPLAGLLAWALSSRMGSRVTAIAAIARRYATGDLTRPTGGYGDDELGEVAHVLDVAIQELGRRVNELAHDRRHLRAILAGMVEGVIVIDASGRLAMANEAARAMLKLDETATGRRYQEWMRQPELFAQLATALGGEAPAGVEFRPARASRGPRRRAVPRGAPCWCSTTSATSGAPTGCAGTSSPTSATSFARRSRQSAATSRPCWRIRRRKATVAGSSRSSRGTPSAWSGWSRTCCAWRASTPVRKPPIWSDAT